MKKPSAFVIAAVENFMANKPGLGEKFKSEYQSYYGFVAAKVTKEPFAAPFVSAHHLAASLDVSLKSLERLRMSGGGPPYIKVRKQVRYPIVELDNWIRENLTDQG